MSAVPASIRKTGCWGMDLVNSERESVIESAIDTISAIGRDSTSRSSVWLHKQSEASGVAEAIWGRKDRNEVAEDSRNLHSDASSIYPDNNKFGSLQSTLASEYRLHTPEMNQNLQRQDTFENTPTLGNRKEFEEVTPNGISQAKQTYGNNHLLATRMKATSSNTGTSGEHLLSTSSNDSKVEENCKATLHGHEVTISELRPPKTLYSNKGKSTSSVAQAKKITFKGSYSCKIIRRERDAGIKLQRELQMRRKDEGSPKVVTLAQKKCHEMDSYLSREKPENASLMEQMKRWLNIPKSRQGRNETFGEISESRKETRNAYSNKQQEFPPHRRVKFHSPSLCSEYNEAEAGKLASSICCSVSDVTTEQARLPNAVSEGISDTLTYNCMKRSDVHRRIEDLKKLKRSKRKTMSIAPNGPEFNLIGGQTFDANIAAEQTYRKGIPDHRRIQTEPAIEKASPKEFVRPKALKSKICDEENGFTTHFYQNEHGSLSHETTKGSHSGMKNVQENTSADCRESTTKPQICNTATKDVSCGLDSYVTTGRHGLSYEILDDDLPTLSNSHKMRDKNVGTNEIESLTKNTPSYAEDIPEHTNGNLYSQLWDNLQSDGETAETPKSIRPPTHDHRYRILYIDGYGNSRTVPQNIWIQLQSSLFRTSPNFSDQSPM